MGRPGLPGSFQNGSQGDFPTRRKAGPLKRNRMRLWPGRAPWKEKPGSTTIRIRSRRVPEWPRGPAGLSPSLPRGHPAPIAPAPPRRPWRCAAGHQLPSQAKWECPAGKVSDHNSVLTRAASARGEAAPPASAAARWRSCPTAAFLPGCTNLGTCAHQRRGPGPGRRLPWRPPCFAPARAAAGPSHRLALTGDPGCSLPVPAAAGAAIRPGSVRARPASPRPPAGAGHAGAARPLAGPGRGRRARVIPRPLPGGRGGPRPAGSQGTNT